MRVNTILERINIDSLEFKGKGVARVDGKVLFVEDALPGEVLDVRVVRNKRDHAFAVPVKYHIRSEDRIEPFCSHFGVCGGCKWQQLPYEKQLLYKEQFVLESLKRIGRLDLPEIEPIISCEATRHYRNKLEFTFSNRRWLPRDEFERSDRNVGMEALGFHMAGHFDKVLDIDKCYLQQDPSNAIRQAVKEYALLHNLQFFDLRRHSGFLRNLFIRISGLNEVLVLVSLFEDNPEARDGLLSHLRERFPGIRSLNYVINSSKNDALTDQEVVTYHGQPFINEALGDLRIRIGPKSFYQTNSKQAEKLYGAVLRLSELQGNETVYDLYSGIGSIALYISGHCKKVIGVEQVGGAVEDANENARLNGIGNCQFIAADVRHWLRQLQREGWHAPDLLITDPPRAGMHPKVVLALCELGIPRIVYVSCNPTTQARDLAVLSARYDIVAVQPVDMFPQTYHIENIVSLKLKGED